MIQDTKILAALASAYAEVGVPADRLPYTPDFERLLALVKEKTSTSLARDRCWRLLTDARKRGQLPRLCR